MTSEGETVDQVRKALQGEPRIRPTQGPLRVSFSTGDLVLEGEVDHVSGKRLALEVAARLPDAERIVDRLHVRPARPMGDAELRDRVRDALLAKPALADCTLRAWSEGRLETVREPTDPTGAIEIRAEDGVVTLDGDVASLVRKRIAGVLAWRVPGRRDVINGLGVTPPEPDGDDAITDAVRQALARKGTPWSMTRPSG